MGLLLAKKLVGALPDPEPAGRRGLWWPPVAPRCFKCVAGSSIGQAPWLTMDFCCMCVRICSDSSDRTHASISIMCNRMLIHMWLRVSAFAWFPIVAI
eukprot:1399310-Pyramimonas_sp.AAC.1